MKIPFNKPPLTDNEQQYILESINSPKISGDGYGTLSKQSFEKYHSLLCKYYSCERLICAS